MRIELRERTEDHVRIYFEKTRDPDIQSVLPSSATSLDQALENFHRSTLPGASSYGRTIYADGAYIGDIWAYCIDPEETPQAMLSYCIFEKSCWHCGIMTKAVALFLADILPRFQLKSVGAFTYAANTASIRVLEKNGFVEKERFREDGIESLYLQRDNTALITISDPL